MRGAIAVAALVLALCSPARAATTIVAPPLSGYPYQAWVDEAQVPTPPATIEVIETPCPEAPVEACTVPGLIWFAVDAEPRPVFYHELGHNFDYFAMSDWARQRYQRLVHAPGPWRQPDLGSGSPHELFAESYALCALQAHLPHGAVAVHLQQPIGGARAHNRICHLIARVGTP